MSKWRKLGALAALALPMSILGAACTAEVTQPEDATDTANEGPGITEENEGTAAESPNATELDARDIDRYPRRGFCERRCSIEYQECLRGSDRGFDNDDRGFDRDGFGRRRRCEYRFSRCLSYCFRQPYPF